MDGSKNNLNFLISFQIFLIIIIWLHECIYLSNNIKFGKIRTTHEARAVVVTVIRI